MIFVAVGVFLWIILPFILIDTIKENKKTKKLGEQILADCNRYIENNNIEELENNEIESKSEYQGNLNLF